MSAGVGGWHKSLLLQRAAVLRFDGSQLWWCRLLLLDFFVTNVLEFLFASGELGTSFQKFIKFLIGGETSRTDASLALM